MKEKKIIEYGDFQTPLELADMMCNLLLLQGENPPTIVEPNCGKGNILKSAIDKFNNYKNVVGYDINSSYLDLLKQDLQILRNKNDNKILIEQKNFFDLDFKTDFEIYQKPILFIGNPPWVTNSVLGVLNSKNLPLKNNFQNHKGIEAITGKGNFDISEWMLIKLVEYIGKSEGILAMLCKSSVARKILVHAWKNNLNIGNAKIYKFDSKKYFGVSVDSCFFICRTLSKYSKKCCQVFSDIAQSKKEQTIGFYDNTLISNIGQYFKYKQNRGSSQYIWRNGIKHDASNVMELIKENGVYINAQGVKNKLEDEYIFPLLKSSDIANNTRKGSNKYVIITQKYVGEETRKLEFKAPLLWDYLNRNSHILNLRKSSIYKNKPLFSIFSIGDYSFSPYKIAISSLYKKLEFTIISSFNGKSILVDDTCNFLSCYSKEESELLLTILNSKLAKGLYNSLIFWDSKRPITIDILKQLDLHSVAKKLGLVEDFEIYLNKNPTTNKFNIMQAF